MFSTTIAGLLAHKYRLFATALAVTLGVSLMVGTLVLVNTILGTFDDLFGNVYRGTDAVVRAEAAFDAGPMNGEQRGRVSASLVNTVARVPGVAVAEGSVGGYARLVGKDGKALGNPNSGAPAIGINWSDNKDLNTFTLVEGTAPRADDEVVIDRKSAKDGDLKVGDVTTVLVKGPPLQVRIAGIARFGSADSPGGATVVAFPTAVAQRVIDEPGEFDSINVVAADGVSQEQVARNIRAVLPASVEVITGQKLTDETQSAIRSGLAFFRTFMLIFAVVALLVGSFMIFNTFSISVAQRTRETGLLRALGASRRQVLFSVLIEALVVGVIASLLGIVAGLGVALGLKSLLDALGMLGMQVGSLVFTLSTGVLAMVVGVAITLLGAFSPARKAAKVPPVAAMQEGVAGSTGYGSKERVFVGVGILALGIATLTFGLFGNPGSPVMVVGLGALLVFFAVSVLGRTISLPLSRFLSAPLPRLRGITGDLAAENTMRNPKRTAATASALMIGVGLVAFMSIFAQSYKASVAATLDEAFNGDFIIQSGGGITGGVDPSLAQRLQTLPEVSDAAGIRIGFAKIGNKVAQVVGVNAEMGFRLVNAKPLQGKPSDLDANSIAIYKDVATSENLHVGDTVNAVFKDTGQKKLRVGMIYGENQQAGNYVMGLSAYDANFANHYDYQIFVKKAAGVSTSAALAAIDKVTKAYPGTKVMDQADVKRAAGAQMNQMLTLVYVLLALAIFIAFLGIANTLALSIFERTRELGLLRAVGMTRSQLRSTIRWEAVVIALQGTLLGLVIGVFFGWALFLSMKDEGASVFSIPVLTLLVVVVVAGIAGMLAAMLPSRRAAKLDVLRAVVTE
jgi:putative ABC transport system permease protein